VNHRRTSTNLRPAASSSLLLVLLVLFAWSALPPSSVQAQSTGVQVFVDDLLVDLQGLDQAEREDVGRALAAEVQAEIAASNATYRPMTFQLLKLQLAKEERAQLLGCSRSKDRQACVQTIVDNFGCSERLTGSVQSVGARVQVVMTRLRDDEPVSGGVGTRFARSVDLKDLIMATRGLAASLYGASGAGGKPGPSEPIGEVPRPFQDYTPPSLVMVTFASEPEGAMVLVDDQAVCDKAPCARNVLTGAHRVVMSKARYQSWRETVSLEGAGTIRGELLPAFGWLTVSSKPEGLQVTLDGESIGVTPIREKELDPRPTRPYEVLITDPRYFDAGARVSIEANEEKSVHEVLVPKEGGLLVTVEEPDHDVVEAEILLDGQVVGKQPWSGKRLIGEAALSARVKDGRESEVKRVTVVMNETTKVVLEVPERAHESSNAGDSSWGVAFVWALLPEAPGGPIEILQTEVTVAQFKACRAAGECGSDPDTSAYCNWRLVAARLDHPINCVDWNQAKDFCVWAGGRLPTEDEWRHAATSGGKAGYTYPWGNEKPNCERAVYDDEVTTGSAESATDGCGEDRTWPVCSKPAGASEHDVCDLVGNVWEWTSTCETVEQDKECTYMGGGWLLGGSYLLALSSGAIANHLSRAINIGFRCVR
jgi:hypothetical protein